jgi:hypothetical protein
MAAKRQVPGAEDGLVGQRVDVGRDVQKRSLVGELGDVDVVEPDQVGWVAARIAVANWLVSSLGDVTWETIFRFLCVALNSGINLSAAASVASLIQKVTVPLALTPNVDAGLIPCVPADAAGAPVMDSTIAGPRAKTTSFT